MNMLSYKNLAKTSCYLELAVCNNLIKMREKDVIVPLWLWISWKQASYNVSTEVVCNAEQSYR